MPLIITRALLSVGLIALTTLPLLAQTPAKQELNELDAFMEKVLAQREVNRLTLQQFILDETEEFDVLGPGRAPLHRMKREFTWYLRDGQHVRSPLRFDGVAVGEEARREYEDRWIRREQRRLERKKREEAEKSAESKVDPDEPEPPDPGTGSVMSTGLQPRFVSEAYFLEFKFEPGNYYLAGREQIEGKNVLRIEYYPERMFGDSKERDKDGPDEAQRSRRRRAERAREKEIEQRVERGMNKTALITIWVDPAEHQIVKYTFDNVWMDFLPGGWLVRVDEVSASMTMGQPLPDVWLPRDMEISAGITLAVGSFDAMYSRKFSEYRLANVTSRVRVPKAPDMPAPPVKRLPLPEDPSPESGPYVADEGDETQATPEVVAEVRIHGNAYVSDADVLRLAGISVGQPLSPDAVPEIERQLRESGYFEAVEVRKRYRSLTSTSDVALVLIVHERPGVTSVSASTSPAARPWQRFKSRLMFLPIIGYSDGYGFTYGGRVSTIDLLGAGERLSVPLTWGGTRRAALEFQRTFASGPLTSIESSIGVSRRENPHFEIGDRRIEGTVRAERHFARIVRTGVEASRSSVAFGALDDRLWTLGADAVLDTRGDPAFPRNAILLGAGWKGLHVSGRDSRINRYVADARGYLGLIGQSVLAARVQYTAADATLPDYERLLVGGSSTLRGFRTGTFIGDRTLVTSAELRLPLTSVLSGARLGVTAFVDVATAYDVGVRLEDATWHRGVGAGVFLLAPLVHINLDVARGLKTGDTRLHLASGFSF